MPISFAYVIRATRRRLGSTKKWIRRPIWLDGSSFTEGAYPVLLLMEHNATGCGQAFYQESSRNTDNAKAHGRNFFAFHLLISGGAIKNISRSVLIRFLLASFVFRPRHIGSTLSRRYLEVLGLRGIGEMRKVTQAEFVLDWK